MITYYDKEEDRDFVYLAVEKCEGNLENYVELMKIVRTSSDKFKESPFGNIFVDNPKEILSPKKIKKIMWQALNGLKFLHENNIVHRDIKPHNILLNRLKDVKLSDMGLSKQLHEDQISYHTEVKGSLGWQPSEVIYPEKEQEVAASAQKTYKVDIFSLGCTFYYLLSKGNHPFGQRFEREKNILKGAYKLDKIEYELVEERYTEAV